MNAVPQLLFDALSLGGIYAMAALGIALTRISSAAFSIALYTYI